MNDGHKRKPQKHQNRTAFKIVFDPQALDKHKKVSFRLLCVRCADQMQWKLTYNKYKKMSEPTKCNYCLHKIVVRSYMRACDECCMERHTCPKCLDDTSQEHAQPIKNEKEKREESQLNESKMAEVMKTLKERSRRTVRRGLQKGTISWDRKENCFVDEEGAPLVGLHLRKAFAEGDSDCEDHPDQEIDVGNLSADDQQSHPEEASGDQDGLGEDQQKEDIDEVDVKHEIDVEHEVAAEHEIDQKEESCGDGEQRSAGQGEEQDWQDEDDEEDWEDEKKEKPACCRGPCGSKKKCCK